MWIEGNWNIFHRICVSGLECCRKLENLKKVVGVLRYLGNSSSLQLECVRVLHQGFLFL